MAVVQGVQYYGLVKLHGTRHLLLTSFSLCHSSTIQLTCCSLNVAL